MAISGILGVIIDSLRNTTRDINNEIVGTATSTVAGKLVDNGATFVSDGIAINDTIYNTTDTTSATVVSVDSEIQLTLSGNIFVSGGNYRKVGIANSELLWQDSNWISYLNPAEQEICRRALVITDYSTASICTITLVTNTAAYTLSQKIILIESILPSWNTSITLKKRTKNWLNAHMAGWQGYSAGEPEYFIEEANHKLILVPKPSSTYNTNTLLLTVKRLPAVDLSASATTPEVGAKYYEDLKLYALYLAYNKTDSQTYNAKLSLEYLAKFNASVGERTNANIERIVKEEPEGIQFGVSRR